jgi:hypothetical protein
MARRIRLVIGDRVRTVLARWVDWLIVVLVAALVVVLYAFIWDPAAIQNTISGHAPG